ncbi:hypothetical protein AYO38_07820 [bacterium SCGC AG-212-C10]|nr:hypothetical protein AYO38_07820 [bacterium SCGC AG-212-C10]
MNLLLDTNVFLWLQIRPERINDTALTILRQADNQRFLSLASCWEIAIKYGLGKLSLPETPDIYVPKRMRTSAAPCCRSMRTMSTPRVCCPGIIGIRSTAC